MKFKVAFAGFRHGHIYGLYDRMKNSKSAEIVACCEENAPAASEARGKGVEITHRNFKKMLSEVDFDILATGDYYGIRGARAIAALESGRHVIADKPLCVSLDELKRIRSLSTAKKLAVGLMLDFRLNPNLEAAHRYIASGKLGEVHSIGFGGQHPLNWGTRPHWYFERGKHGGTINDIAIHGLDAIEYMTGRFTAKALAARTWNAFASECRSFKDSAHLMYSLDNGCGVLGDVSYAAPNGASNPFYWRFTIWGEKGVLEFNYADPGVKLLLPGAKELKILKGIDGESDYLEIFFKEASGGKDDFGTKHVLDVSEKCLALQKLAEK